MTTAGQRVPAGRGVCVCVTPGVTLGGNLAQTPTAHTSPLDSLLVQRGGGDCGVADSQEG